MTQMRQLTDEEKKVIQTQLSRLKEEFEFYEYQVEYGRLMLEKGLKVNLIEQQKSYTNKKDEMENQREITAQKISHLQEQLEKGVEIKEKKINYGDEVLVKIREANNTLLEYGIELTEVKMQKRIYDQLPQDEQVVNLGIRIVKKE